MRGVRWSCCSSGAEPQPPSSRGGCAIAAYGAPRARATTRENPAGLTARELEVLALVGARACGTRDRRTAVLSESTVDHHVAAVLRKLGVRSRREAAAASRQDTASPPKLGNPDSQSG